MERPAQPRSGVFPSAPPTDTVRVYRPVGDVELRRILAMGARRFPPLLPSQRHFFPMLSRASAESLAREFRALRRGPTHVVACDVQRAFLQRFPVQGLGEELELRVPAEELEAFNAALVGTIQIVSSLGEAKLG